MNVHFPVQRDICDVLHLDKATERNLHQSYNNKRRNSFSEYAINVKNDVNVLKKNRGSWNINSLVENECVDFASDYFCNINFDEIGNVNNIDSTHYIYLGAAERVVKSTHGISLDEMGNLILIKGECCDFFKGVIKKNTSGYKYETAKIILNNENKMLQFSSLYLDENGKLIGKEKSSNKLYEIHLNLNAKNFDFTKKNANTTSDISIRVIEYTKSNIESLSFKTDNNSRISFTFEKNKLYLNELVNCKNKFSYDFMNYEVKLPFKKNVKILSVKKTKNMLQLETCKDNKKYIYYLDPLHLSVKSDKICFRNKTHKPPQSLYTATGNDPHEHYHSGQPFSSDRLGNFSSRYIPLFSAPIDNFRINLKKVKNYFAQGKRTEAIKYIRRILDPGFEAIAKYAKKSHSLSNKKVNNAEKTSLINDTQSAVKESVLLSNKEYIQNNHEKMNDMINQGLSIDSKDNFVEGLTTLIKKIDKNESISLEDMNKFSMFFGVARGGGYPFVKCWFFGVLASVLNNRSLSIEKRQNGNIQFTFAKNHKKEGVFLAGTGQGTEEVWNLNHGGVNYLACLPAEANLILVAHKDSSEAFSFEIPPEHLETFLKGLVYPEKAEGIDKYVIDKSTLTQVDDYNYLMLVEAKSEIRPQIGFMADPNTFLVVPRTALGLRLAAFLVNYNKNKMIQILPTESENDKKLLSEDISEISDTTKKQVKHKLSFLKFEAGLFHEVKIMPIGLMFKGELILCFPMPLIEEFRPIKKAQLSSDYLFEKEWIDKENDKERMNSINFPQEFYDGMKKIEHYMNSNPENMVVYRDIDRITDVRSNYVFNKTEKEGKIKSTKSKGVKLKNIDNRDDSFENELINLKNYFSSLERDSLNKHSITGLECHYSLSPSEKYLKTHAKIDSFLEELKKDDKDSSKKNKDILLNELNEICDLIKDNEFNYKLSEIKIKRQSGIVDKVNTLPLIISSFRNEKKFVYNEIVGDITFEDEAGSSRFSLPEKATIHSKYLI